MISCKIAARTIQIKYNEVGDSANLDMNIKLYKTHRELSAKKDVGDCVLFSDHTIRFVKDVNHIP